VRARAQLLAVVESDQGHSDLLLFASAGALAAQTTEEMPVLTRFEIDVRLDYEHERLAGPA